MIARLAAMLLALGLQGACVPSPVQDAAPPDRPMRIVSLDYCADQFVLKFADTAQILAVSPDAVKDFSYMKDRAAGLPSVRPSAEDVLILRPDLVVRAYGGGPGAVDFFQRAGIPVLEVGWSPDLAAVRTNTLRLAEGIGQGERGRAVVADMDARLDALERAPAGPKALYATPGGVTTGPGGLIGEMMGRAGLENFETRPGWHALPLERLAYEHPDLFVFADFEGGAGPWSAARHGVFRDAMDAGDPVEIEGAWTSCGGWFVIEAVEALAARSAP